MKFMHAMDNVYLKIFSVEESTCLAPIETIAALFIVKYCDSNAKVNLVIEKSDSNRKECSYTIDVSSFIVDKVMRVNDVPSPASSCELPSIVEVDGCCTAGLCATLRRIVKQRLLECPGHHCQNLLGFKDSCLLACSEASVWTKFCEVDIISALKFPVEKQLERVKLPKSVARFERHMSEPVRLHNVYKYTKSKKFINSADFVVDENGLPEHSFAEGSSLTLSDVIIFVCFYALLNVHLNDAVFELLPFTLKWYTRMKKNDRILRIIEGFFLEENRNYETCEQYILPETEKFSLYKSDPKRYKPKNRIFTRQEDVENALLVVRERDLEMTLDNETFGMEETLDWKKIPLEATPKGGSLPESRLTRKYQQLENLCKPILKIAKADDVIVDFCSGGGHLGILVAYLLPRCKVILLENKEESLKMAKERVQKLGLKNIKFFQSNLDYFKGDFDIGTSLHACGVATDLVMRQCINQNAAFVCCPCCYGSIQDCYHITYPRSKIFKEFVDKKSFFVLGHSADQTHDADNVKTKQGYECMAVVDADRKLLAEQFGYKVYLGKLVPPSCTPKNNLIVGLPKSKLIDV